MTKSIKRTLVLIAITIAMIAFSIAVAPFSTIGAKAESTNEAKIGETEYATIQEAINDAENGETVTLLKNVTTPINNSSNGSHCIVIQGKDVIFDLNGKTFAQPVSQSQGLGMAIIVIRTDAKLTIRDSVGGGKISATGTAIQLTGTLVLESGIIEVGENPSEADAQWEMAYAIWMYAPNATDAPTFKMSGGEIAIGTGAEEFAYANSIAVDSSYSPMENYGNAVVEISGGTVESEFYLASTQPTVSISGGSFGFTIDESYLADGFAMDANGAIVDLSEYRASALDSLNNAKRALLEANGYTTEKLAEIDTLYATAKTAIESGTKATEIESAIVSFVASASAVDIIPLATVKSNAIAEIEEAYKKLLKDNNYTKENKGILKQYLDSAKESIQNATNMSTIEGVKISFEIKTGLVKKDNLAWVWIVLPISLLVLAVSLAFLIRVLPKKEKTKKERRAQVAPVTEKKKEIEMRVAPVVTEPEIKQAPVVEEPVEEPIANEKTEETPEVEETPVADETTAEEETVATVVEEPATEETVVEETAVEEVENPVVEEPVAETAVVKEEPAVDFALMASVKSKTFEEKLNEASEEVKAFYEELKNGLLSYKKVKSRLSKKADSFRVGRKLIAKIAFAGKSVKCYLALNPDEIEKKFHHRSVSEKKAYASVPTLMRIKSKRAVKNTLTLIEKLASENELIKK